MALPDTFKLAAGSSRSSGIASEAITNGSTFTGAGIDNATNLDYFGTVEIVWSFGVTPTANKAVELYVLYAVDGTNYEEVGPQAMVGGFSPPADTSSHRRTIVRNLPLLPYAFKLAVKNVDTGQTITVTANVYTHAEKVVD